MKIRSTEILKARLEEELSQMHVAKHLRPKLQPWLSRVEHGHILITEATERKIVALIRQLGQLRRAVAIEERKLAGAILLPAKSPSHREGRA